MKELDYCCQQLKEHGNVRVEEALNAQTGCPLEPNTVSKKDSILGWTGKSCSASQEHMNPTGGKVAQKLGVLGSYISRSGLSVSNDKLRHSNRGVSGNFNKVSWWQALGSAM
jgi:hypothetical protein